MNLSIQGSNNFTVSTKMKDYITKRVEKLDYFKNHIQDIIFHLNAEKHEKKVDAILSIKKFGTHKFSANAQEIYTAIDKVVHKMDVKINREKSKIQEHNGIDHEKIVDFFYEHEENNPEPTKNISISNKPMTIIEAVLEMKLDNQEFFGFQLIEDKSNISIAFLRVLPDNTIYIFKQEDENTYTKYPITVENNSVSLGKKIREIKLKTANLIEAQKAILEHDYRFDIFIDNSSNKSFLLYKENNGKWNKITGNIFS